MIHGIHIESRIYGADFTQCEFWNPEKFGIKIDSLTPLEGKLLPKKGINKKYSFLLASDVYHGRVQETLNYLKNKNIKIFLSSREPAVPDISIPALFSLEHFKKEYGKYYFIPDFVMGAGQHYCDLWKDKTKCGITGYPRFEQYIALKKANKNEIRKKYKLSPDRKIIFFPSFPELIYKKINGKDDNLNIKDELDTILRALERISKNKKYQIVVKIHPLPFRCYLKSLEKKVEYQFMVTGLLRHYFENKSNDFVVFGDDRNSGKMIKELLFSSDVVVGATSTTLLEAMLLNKPVLNCAVGQLFAEDIFELSKETKTVTTEDEIVDAIISENVTVCHKSKLVEKYLGPVDGKSCERMCNIIKANI